MKNLLSINDVQEEIHGIMELAGKFKQKPVGNELHGKVLAMIFEKSSTRTRISFEVAMLQLGGNSLYLSASDLQLGRGEPIEDTARVISRYVDGVMIRARKHEDVVKFSQNSEIPVINGLTNLEHPCQALTDIFTVYEIKNTYKLHLAFLGDGNNVCNSLLLAAALVGMDMTVVCPTRYRPDIQIFNKAQQLAEYSGSNLQITSKIQEGVQNADVIYTDVWISMGDEEEASRRITDLKNYQVNEKLLSMADPDAVVLHCLPAVRGQEITEKVLNGSQSVVWDQAENRLHVQKAILSMILGENINID